MPRGQIIKIQKNPEKSTQLEIKSFLSDNPISATIKPKRKTETFLGDSANLSLSKYDFFFVKYVFRIFNFYFFGFELFILNF